MSNVKNDGPLVVELFAGAGLFGHAFRREGFRLSGAYEMDVAACSTYFRNLKSSVKTCDLSQERPVGRADVLIAGPPCQGFSSLGRRDPDDPRNNLGLIVPEWAQKLGASVVVIENVASYLQSETWKKLRDRFETKGYEAEWAVINAADIGAPQRRFRSFTVFSKRGKPQILFRRKAPMTVREAFEGLPKNQNRATQHFVLPRTAFALKRIRLVPAGGDIRDIARIAPELVPPSWFRTAGKIIDIWGRMVWDDVAPTIRTGFLNPSRGRFLHPSENRPISFREAARLQMVPDSFYFNGGPEQIARQIGNGVSLGVGRLIAQIVRRLF